MSIYVKIAIVGIIVTFAVLAWTLCAIAKDADRRAKEWE
jgi:hypothetical protein